MIEAKASFNFFTVNKKPKDLDKQLDKEKEQLEKRKFSSIGRDENGDYNWNIPISKINRRFEDYQITLKSDYEKRWVHLYFRNSEQAKISLTLQETMQAMKEFKAGQKALFYEVIKHLASEQVSSYYFENEDFLLGRGEGLELDYESFSSYQKCNELFSLFQFKSEKEPEKNFEAFIQLDRKIIKLSERLNQNEPKGEDSDKIKEEITGKKKKKGERLFGKDCYFKQYGTFLRNLQTRRHENRSRKGRHQRDREGKDRRREHRLLGFDLGEKKRIRFEGTPFVADPQETKSTSI